MIRLELSIEEVNTILQSLGHIAYAQVFELVGKVQSQANAQLPAAATPEANGQPEPQPEATPSPG